MPLAAYLNEIPHPIWIGATILGLLVHWPIGLAILFIGLATGNIGRCGWRRWAACGPAGAPPMSGQRFASRDEFHQWKRQWKGYFRHGWQQPQASAPNSAFDDYRAETLHRLEEEQKEFQEYLERLRRARDKAEFDSFMAERGRYTPPPSPPQS